MSWLSRCICTKPCGCVPDGEECRKPRCRARLGRAWSDEECEAVCRLEDARVRYSYSAQTHEAWLIVGEDWVRYESLMAAAEAALGGA